ncbi:toxin-antitoxin system YwqK family antitoxin [Maribellus sediminis]|uniref:toxin-antitoxin system YwqK family antitoxin n=1 Tax=Maribellus sediminis TaxID=2696285 RepID=UPI001431B993|nr:toxin-antitoxin system YwqK family antitoxin [Maribellus sediminis]
MRILILLLILLPGIAFSQINQTDANGLRQGHWEKRQDNGRLIYEGEFKDDKPVGEWKRYHPGGQLKALIVYRGDTAHTELYDVWRKKLTEGDYVNQKKQGVWKIFKENFVTADEEYVDGVKNGVAHQYFDTGEVMEKSHWLNGKKDGDYEMFYKNGKPYLQCKMKDDQRHGLFLVYYENGQLEREAAYKNGLRDGEWKFYDSEGNHQYSLFYNEGKILNPLVRDSIDNLKMQELEKNKDLLTDPEKFMDDPSEYMRKSKMFR